MGRQTGTCEVCGRDGLKVKKAKGLMACGGCGILLSKVNSDPDLVVSAMRKVHGDRYFAAQQGESAQVIADIRKALGVDADVLAWDLPEIINRLKAQLDQAAYAASSYGAIMHDIKAALDTDPAEDEGDLPGMVRDAMEELKHCRPRITELDKELQEVVKKSSEAMCRLRDILQAGPDEHIIEVAGHRMNSIKELTGMVDELTQRLNKSEDVINDLMNREEQRPSSAPDMIPLSRLIGDRDLRHAVNTIASIMDGVVNRRKEAA